MGAFGDDLGNADDAVPMDDDELQTLRHRHRRPRRGFRPHARVIDRLLATLRERTAQATEDERERIANLVERWKPYAGCFSARDLADFIRQGKDLPDAG